MENKILESVDARFQVLKYRKDDFTIIEVVSKSDALPLEIPKTKDKGVTRFTVLGKNLPCESKSLETRFYGKWVKNKYGLQFECSHYEILPPSTKTGIKQFLKNLKIKGVGKISISLIVTEFGKETLDVCINDYESLTKVRGISLEKAKAIHQKVIESQSFNELSIFLGQFGIPPRQIEAINKKLGASALTEIGTNPYIVMDVSGVGFNTADAIARGLNIMLDSDIRIKSAIISVLNRECLSFGDLYVEKDKLQKETLLWLNKGFESPIVNEEKYNKVFYFMTNGEKPSLVIRANKLVYTKINDDIEKETAKKLVKLLKKSIPANIKRNYSDRIHSFKGEIFLSEKQLEAVEMCLHNPVSIITGGPGTGKTTILKAVISLYKSVNPTRAVNLLAPTGKAARRMAESTGYEANTIHSALQLYPNEENGYSLEQKDLPMGLIIIDEFSMVDQNIIYKLLKSIKGESNQLVMVGDVNQLPSVGAGDVLKELIASKVIPTSELTEIFRQKDGGLIIENAININSGKHNLIYNKEEFELINSCSEDDGASKAIDSYLKEVNKYGIDNVMMLCPLKRQIGNRNVCVETLNRKLQDRINPSIAGEISVRVGNIDYRPGDRIMQLKNVPDASNGDTGVIDEIVADESDGMIDYLFHITFDNGNCLEYTQEDMEDVDLAYAMTIHKSQGSEAKSIIIPCLSTQKSEFFSRNLLYTAVTRAKEKVTIIGDKGTVNYCINNVTNGKRHTLLSKRLIVNYEKST